MNLVAAVDVVEQFAIVPRSTADRSRLFAALSVIHRAAISEAEMAYQ
jgi:hypothetical protein